MRDRHDGPSRELEHKRSVVTMLACEHCGGLHEYQPRWNPSPELPEAIRPTPRRDPHDVFHFASTLGLADWFTATFMTNTDRQLFAFQGRTGIWEAPHWPAEESQCVATTTRKRRCRNPIEYGQTLTELAWYSSPHATLLVHIAPAYFHDQRCPTHRDRPHIPDHTAPEWRLLHLDDPGARS